MTWLSRIREGIADYAAFVTSPWRTQNCQDELTLSVLRRIEHLETRMAAMRPGVSELGSPHMQDIDASGGPE